MMQCDSITWLCQAFLKGCDQLRCLRLAQTKTSNFKVNFQGSFSSEALKTTCVYQVTLKNLYTYMFKNLAHKSAAIDFGNMS